MNKKEVKSWLIKEMNTLTRVSKDFHRDCLADRKRCAENNVDVHDDRDYNTHSRLQREYQAKADEIIYILEKLNLITYEEEEKMVDELFHKCHAFDEVIK